MARLNRDMPHALRAVCEGGLKETLGGAGMIAQIAHPYVQSYQSYDHLMLPCLLEFCRRAGRAPLEVMWRMMNRIEQRYVDGGLFPVPIRNTWPVCIRPAEQAFVNCPVLLCAEMYTDLDAVAHPPVPAPDGSYLIAFFQLTDDDRAFMARWREEHDNVDWPMEPHIEQGGGPGPMQHPIQVNGRVVDTVMLTPLRMRWQHVSNQVTARRWSLMCRYGQRMYGPRIAELHHAREGLRTEVAAMRWCREQRRAALQQATAAERVQIQQRTRLYMDRIRDLWARIARVDDQIHNLRNTVGACREILGDVTI